MPMKPVDLEKFISTTSNIHEAVVVASKRARQVNEDTRIEFNQRIETIAAKTESEATEESEVNPDQLKVSLEFEKRSKPTDVALDELMDGEVKWHYKEPEERIPLTDDDE